MDVSDIDINDVEIFNLGYIMAQNIFGVEPIEASAKKQKKIRKWFEKKYVDKQIISKDILRYIPDDANDAKFIEFLKACHDQIQLNDSLKKQEFDKCAADLSEDVIDAIWTLLNNVYCDGFQKNGADIHIKYDMGLAYECTLVLMNASGLPDSEIDCFSFENGELIKQKDGYCLVGDAQNFEEDSSTPFTICFTDAKVKTATFRADVQAFAGTPWNHLQSVAESILEKHSLPAYNLNDQEKENLPLIAEIVKLSLWSVIPDEFDNSDFSQLKSYVTKYGFNDLLSLIENLEKEYFNDKKKYRLINKLTAELNKQNYEALWRELYGIISETQSAYPIKPDIYCDQEILNKTREDIQKLMEAHGYSGTYPNFVKIGAVRGLRLQESYDLTYLVGMEKNVVYRIHCTEEYFNEHLSIEFLCGTALLRKNETAQDIYSCLFKAKGRRLFHTVTFERDYINAYGEKVSDNLEQRVQIAVKKTELKKLTKEERKEYIDPDTPFLAIFLSVFIMIGGFFGIFMTLGFMVIAVIITLIFGGAHLVSEILREFPWWTILVGSWVLFGGAMGVSTIIAKRQ